MGTGQSKVWCRFPRCDKSCLRCKCCCRSEEEEKMEMTMLGYLNAARSYESVNSTSADVLTIKSVELCIETNGKEHHTDRFELMRQNGISRLPKLVVRRGQPFRLRLNCNRPFNGAKDAISLIFSVADDEKPSHGHGTMVGIALQEKLKETVDPKNTEWSAGIESISGDLMEICIKSSVGAPVTQWRLDFDTKLLTDRSTKTYSLPQPFYLLFNPWCQFDQVHMPSETKLNEYVMNDTTLIYRGSYNRIRPTIWKLGQFDQDVLDSALYLVTKIGLVSPSFRGDPIRVSRALSAAVNSNDNDGVLEGRWKETFPNGVAPTHWVGSTEILQKFWQRRKPVKYGQCWVFAGVLTTVARALGLPSRVITNYCSAHDTQQSLTVDYFVDEKGEKMEEMNSDSIWNFHVWNEVWMERPDLETGPAGGYGGWQAIDSTPQETSDNMYRCGPASVLAVKLGEVKKPYDHGFLYAEVNADKVFWKYAGPMQPLKLLSKDTYAIGIFISTKAVGAWIREDVTNTYKYSEKSMEERDTMLKALRHSSSSFARYYLNEEFNEVSFDFELRDDIKIGEPFSVILRVKNRSKDKSHEVSGHLNVDTVTYNGRQNDHVKSHDFLEEIEAASTKLIKLDVAFDEYYPRLLDQGSFNISCAANVRNTDYDYFAQDDFRVRKPDIKITFDGEPVTKEVIEVTIRLTNPLPITLRKGVFHVEGGGLDAPLILRMPEIPVRAIAEGKFKITPPWSGRHTIVAKFDSKELDDVDGFLAFEASPRLEDGSVASNGFHENDVIARTDVIP